MTETRNADARDETQHTLVVPDSINMVALLGPSDEHLAVIEQAFDADVHVRGNEITLGGEPGRGRPRRAPPRRAGDDDPHRSGRYQETVERVVGMLRAETRSGRPTC